MNLIDHGENDPLEFDLTSAERDEAAFAQAQLRMQRNGNATTRRSDAYEAQLKRWAAIPDAPRTDADRAAIAADQARRIRAMT
jgi:hypothetical protein